MKRYVDRCSLCQKTKLRTGFTHNTLHPNDIPSNPWEIVSVNFIRPLPESKGHDAIITVIDWFTKMNVAILCKIEIIAGRTTQLFHQHVWSKFGILLKVISDRGPQFLTGFTKELNQLVGIMSNTSTIYHPQTNGLMEWLNGEIKQYFRLFLNYRQDDWTKWIPSAEFTYNNQSSTRHSPFFLNYRYHPQTEMITISTEWWDVQV